MTMPDLWTLLSGPSVEFLGWVLLHFVWQGALLALVLAGALYLLKDHPPSVRYALSCAALVALLALPFGTGLVLEDSFVATESVSTSVVAGDALERIPPPATATTAPPAPSLQARATAWLQPMLPWIVVGWAVGVVLFSIRLAGGAWRVRRLRRASEPAPSPWQDRLRGLVDRAGLDRVVSLRVSPRVESPMVAGWWRPVVLVPVGFLSGLPPDQVEALLLHELAHIRRHDVLVGRLQAVVETLLFFHPATWWVSRQVRQAREACCDDLAVQVGTDRAVYARALAALAERSLRRPRSARALAATDGSLVARIRRLLSPTAAPSSNVRWLSVAVAVVLVVGVSLGLAACASQQQTTKTDAPPQATTKPEEPREEVTETEPPTTPNERSAETKRREVIVLREDSTEAPVRIESEGSLEVDSLEEDVYILRRDGEVDTVDIPEFGHLDRSLRRALDHDSLARAFRLRLHPERLKRSAQVLRLHSDSLERVIRRRVNPDSLERVIESRVNPDSIERVIKRRIDVDSLRHAFRGRLELDSLKGEALRRQLHLSLRFDEGFFESLPGVHRFEWHRGDSTVVFNGDVFTREDFDFDLDVDSLVRRHQLRMHADSLRQHLERMRGRWAEEMPERLRERARHLREQAERLEKRAEEMEAPEPPAAPGDASDSSDASIHGLDGWMGDEGNVARFSARQYENWAQEVTEHLDYEALLGR